VGFVVQEEALPVAANLVEMVGQEKVREFVMSAGGNFELVFTVRPEGLEAAQRACGLTVIGDVVEEGIWMELGAKGGGWKRGGMGIGLEGVRASRNCFKGLFFS
jgi:thiamine monophosphate kinase